MAKTKDKTKKSKTVEQIEKLEKALKENEAQDVVNLVPEEVKADIEADKQEADALETPKEIDVEAEVKKIIEDAEPSEEVKAQVEDFEAGKEEFNKKIETEPENAEKLIQEYFSKNYTLDEEVMFKAISNGWIKLPAASHSAGKIIC
jgi:hypothetical protein